MKRQLEENTVVCINDSDTDDEQIMVKTKKSKIKKNDDVGTINEKEKEAPYYLMTTTEDNICQLYGVNTKHKLFPVVINAIKTREIEEGDSYAWNQSALYNLMVEGLNTEKNDDFKWDDSKDALLEFLELDDLEGSDFIGFLKSNKEDQYEDGIEWSTTRKLLESHIIYLQSWC